MELQHSRQGAEGQVPYRADEERRSGGSRAHCETIIPQLPLLLLLLERLKRRHKVSSFLRSFNKFKRLSGVTDEPFHPATV